MRKSDNDNNEKKVASVKNAKKQPLDKELTESKIEQFISYLTLAKGELYKVSWPTIKETRTTSYVVLGFVVVMSLLLGLVDLILSSIISFILS